MQITLELYELKNLCSEMAELGAANYVKQTKPSVDLISQREAYRLSQWLISWQPINQKKSTQSLTGN